MTAIHTFLSWFFSIVASFLGFNALAASGMTPAFAGVIADRPPVKIRKRGNWGHGVTRSAAYNRRRAEAHMRVTRRRRGQDWRTRDREFSRQLDG